MSIENLVKKAALIPIDILDSDWYAGTNVGLTILNYYLMNKSSRLNNITSLMITSLTIDAVAFPWLTGRTLHESLGLHFGFPYDGIVYLYERAGLGLLNALTSIKNLYDLTKKKEIKS